jgi:hypothetical protein
VDCPHHSLFPAVGSAIEPYLYGLSNDIFFKGDVIERKPRIDTDLHGIKTEEYYPQIALICADVGAQRDDAKKKFGTADERL